MNEKKEVIIRSNSNGTFEVNTGSSQYNGTAKINGESMEATFKTPDPGAELRQPGRGIEDYFKYHEGGLEITPSEVKSMPPLTYNFERTPAHPGNILATLTDNGGRKCFDLQKAKADPASYRVSIGGTETTLENAMRLGFVNIQGDGNLQEDLQEQMAAIKPNDRTNPRNGLTPKESETIDYNEPEKKLMDHLIQSAGFDPDTFYLKALANDTSAGKELSDTLGGKVEPQELQDLLQGVAMLRLQLVSETFESSFGLKPGEGRKVLDKVMNGLSNKGTSNRIIGGLLMGHKDSMREAFRIYSNKDNY